MLLHLLVLAPFIAAILMVATSKEDPKSSSRLAFLFGIAFVAMSVALIAGGAQTTQAMEWFRIPGAKGPAFYYLYSSSLSSWMVLLSTGLSLVALITARNTTCKNYRNFAIGIFALMGAMNGTFLAGDIVLFFFFFEAMVIPAAVLIAGFGGKERTKSAMTFAIYTLVGSAPMMVALWYVLTKADNSLLLSVITAVQTMDPSAQKAVLICFLLAFMVKTPIFPFHGWQAISYSEAPAPLSAILTGAMSKAGVFGLIVWVLVIFPLDPGVVSTMMWLGLATAVYGALMALRANDAKKLLAFSSMGHLGLAVAGVFSLSESMLPAVLVLLVAHGLSAGAQFLLMGIGERMTGTRELDKLGGLARKTPVFGSLFGFVAVMALAVPGTAGFVGEFGVLLSLWNAGPLPALVAGLCIILSAAYMLRFVQKVIFGEQKCEVADEKRMTALEGSSIAIMAVLLLAFGMHPAFVTKDLNFVSDEAVAEMSKASGTAFAIPAKESDEDLSAAADGVDAVAAPMSEEDFRQLDSNLAANGFSEEERASLIKQLREMDKEEADLNAQADEIDATAKEAAATEAPAAEGGNK
ncbi:MAG: NADH-quinone oxidoreductase subunit M [Fibrobacter sp.]|nr:NADH-quinone oxidoreductase subunit M [Fibrobacter sp.]